MQGSGKRQRSSGSTPESGQAKRPRKSGKLSYTELYARAVQEGLRMAIICEGYPKVQVSKDNFVSIQRAIGGLVDGLHEEGCTPQARCYVLLGTAVLVCQDEETRG